MQFTYKALEALKPDPAGKTVEHFATGSDEKAVGLACRVAPTGRKTFTFHYTFAGKRSRMDIGTFPAVTLADARNRAIDARRALESDPPQDPREVRRAAMVADSGALTVSKLFALYVAALRSAPADKRLRTIDDIEVMLKNHAVRFIGDIALAALARLDLSGCVNRIKARGSHSMAFRVHKNMRLAFEWAVNEGHLDANPMARMPPPEEAAKGQNIRPLDDDEIKAFWHGIRDALPAYSAEPYSRILKLCLLTGARLGEIAEIKPGEIADGVLTIPGERSKNRRPHAIPLNADMMAIIGNDTQNPWGKLNGRDIRSIRISDDFLGVPAKLKSVKGYTAHGLRRTVATCMEEIGVEVSTISLCLNHKVDDGKAKASRTTRIYIKPRTDIVMERKRVAFETWAAHLRKIISFDEVAAA
jgi:integrase